MKHTFSHHRKAAAFLSAVLCLSVLAGCNAPSGQPAQPESPQQPEQQMEFPYELTIGGVGYSFAFSYDDLTFLGWESQSVKTEDAEKVLVPAGETSEASEDDAVYYKNSDVRGVRPIFYNSSSENQFVTECEVVGFVFDDSYNYSYPAGEIAVSGPGGTVELGIATYDETLAALGTPVSDDGTTVLYTGNGEENCTQYLKLEFDETGVLELLSIQTYTADTEN